jgi:high-affinity Fe2+/Pb2+ permease
MTVQVFSVPVFFVVFRETLETVIIVSVLLAFLKQTLDGPNSDKKVYKKLVRQVNPPLSMAPESQLNQPPRSGLALLSVSSSAWSLEAP